MTPYVASLRVYEPLGAFPPAERAHWQAYVAAGRAPGRGEAVRVERRAQAGLLAAARVPAGDEEEHACVARLDGVVLVCPWRTALRSWEAALEFRDGLPEGLADAFVPAAAARAAAAALAVWRRDHPDRRVHVRTSAWEVPERWFALFSGDERRLVLGRRRSDEERSLVYRTPMVQARRRTARGLAALRRHAGAGVVVEGLADVARWLEEFHPRSLVELDYGGVAALLDDDALRADESGREVAEVLALLAEGDAAGAAAVQERVRERWRAVAARESAN